MDYAIVWTTEGKELVGHDVLGEELIKVTTGGTHWDFIFVRHGGWGKVRVGLGCRYNPLAMIEQMHLQLINGIEITGEIELEDTFTFSNEFSKEMD